MVETAATIVMSLGSVLLFGYWFRYVCLLTIRTRTAHDYGVEVAEANRLCFPKVTSGLHKHERTLRNLDLLYRCLNRDYEIVSYLLKHAGVSPRELRVQRRALALEYHFVKMCCRVSRRFSIESSFRAIEEMSLIVAYLANSFGERAAAGA
jgi:hypothetical protein